jgi:hypothetical protein
MIISVQTTVWWRWKTSHYSRDIILLVLSSGQSSNLMMTLGMMIDATISKSEHYIARQALRAVVRDMKVMCSTSRDSARAIR